MPTAAECQKAQGKVSPPRLKHGVNGAIAPSYVRGEKARWLETFPTCGSNSEVTEVTSARHGLSPGGCDDVGCPESFVAID